MNALLESTRTAYLFDKDLAAHIVYAEIRAFARTMSLHGPSEAELETLTRRLAWLVDKDLRWTDTDTLVAFAKELQTIAAGTHHLLVVNSAGTVDNTDHVHGSVLIELFWEITLTLGAIKTRWEES